MNRLFFIILFLFIACSYGFCQSANLKYNDYHINNIEAKDNQAISLLKPFAGSMNSTMNVTVAKWESHLEKKLYERIRENIYKSETEIKVMEAMQGDAEQRGITTLT